MTKGSETAGPLGPAAGPLSPAAGPDAVALLRAVGRGLLRAPRGVVWVLPLAWAALLWTLSSGTPDLAPGLALPEWLAALLFDLAHPAAFGLLALFLVPLLPRAPLGEGRWVRWSRRGAAAIFSAVVAYGIVDEFHQSFVPGRVPSLFDVISDATGAGAVLAVVAYLSRSDARRAGLIQRLALGAVASLAAASLSSLASAWLGGGLWLSR